MGWYKAESPAKSSVLRGCSLFMPQVGTQEKQNINKNLTYPTFQQIKKLLPDPLLPDFCYPNLQKHKIIFTQPFKKPEMDYPTNLVRYITQDEILCEKQEIANDI